MVELYSGYEGDMEEKPLSRWRADADQWKFLEEVMLELAESWRRETGAPPKEGHTA